MKAIDPRKRFSVCYWGILLFAAALYAVLAAEDAIWADEAYTFAMLRHSFPEMWRITAADVHPPLYYFVTKLLTAPFGYSQYSVRILSAIWYLLLLAVAGRQGKALFDEKTGLVFMGCFLLYPFGLSFAVEARMYSLAALCITLNALFAYRAWLYHKPADWVGFAVAGTCAAYTHYFALVSACVIYGLLFLCIVLRKRELLKPWLLASAVTIALYIPWLKSFVEQLAFKVNNEYWIEPITVRTLVDYVLSLLYANGLGAYPLFFGLVLLLALYMTVRQKEGAVLLALAVPVATVLLGVAVSLLVRPIFVIRYLACSVPLMVFFLAYGVTRVKNPMLYGALLAVLVMGGSSNLIYSLTTLAPEPGALNGDFTAACADADAYVVAADGSLQVSQVLSYYDSAKPIFVPDPLGADNPYPNKFELHTMDAASMNQITVLTNPGETPNEALFAGFTMTQTGTVHNREHTVDVWQLARVGQ